MENVINHTHVKASLNSACLTSPSPQRLTMHKFTPNLSDKSVQRTNRSFVLSLLLFSSEYSYLQVFVCAKSSEINSAKVHESDWLTRFPARAQHVTSPYGSVRHVTPKPNTSEARNKCIHEICETLHDCTRKHNSDSSSWQIAGGLHTLSMHGISPKSLSDAGTQYTQQFPVYP